MIGLWPRHPFEYSGTTPDDFMGLVFPSGRQAVTHAIGALGGRRDCMVAVPEYSGHCLLTAVAKLATPAPITLATKSPNAVDIVLLYCQWGWEKPAAALTEVADHFPRAGLVVDRVDSLAHSLDAMPWESADREAVQVFSLSKTLGLAGGGCVFHRGTWVPHEGAAAPGDQELGASLAAMAQETLDPSVRASARVWGMADVPVLAPELQKWLADHDLVATIRHAADARVVRRQVIGDRLDEMRWEPWMEAQFSPGTDRVPGLAPLFIKSSEGAGPLKDAIETEVGVEIGLYHFDRSPSYLIPEWMPCLAVPLHGQVPVAKLERILQRWQESRYRADPGP